MRLGRPHSVENQGQLLLEVLHGKLVGGRGGGEGVSKFPAATSSVVADVVVVVDIVDLKNHSNL